MKDFFRNLIYLFHCDYILMILFVFSISTILWINNIYVVLIFSIYSILRLNKYIRLNNFSINLLLFSILYGLIVVLNHLVGSGVETFTYFISPFAFYLLGRYIVIKCRDENDIMSFLLIIVILSSAYLYYATINTISSGIFLDPSRKLIMSDSSRTSSTALGLIAALGMVGLPLFFTFKKPLNSFYSIMWILIFILSIITTITLLNRSALIVLLFCSIFILLYIFKGNFYKFLISVFLIILLVHILFKTGIISDDIIMAYEIRNQGGGNVNEGAGRFHRWEDAILKLYRYPFGWSNNISTYHEFVHNLWLDVARVAGIFPFIAIIIVTIQSIYTTIKLFFKKNNSIRALIIGLQVCFFFASSVEPVVEGLPMYLYLYCLFMGIQEVYYYRYMRREWVK